MQRFQRHIQLPEIGEAGQRKISAASVLVVGAGGLGCPVLQYLASCGVGRIGIVDFDVVSRTNLHRQILYTEADVGQLKVDCAARRLAEMNADIMVATYPHALTAENALELTARYDVLVDGSDNFVTRYLLNDAAVLLDKPLVFGALYKFEGQVSVFNYRGGPTYRCLFPDPPARGDVPNCNEVGVLGVLPGIIGLMQALEVLKIITGVGEVLSGRLLHYNVLTHQQRTLNFRRQEAEIANLRERGRLEAVATDDCVIVPTIAFSEIDFSQNPLPLFVDVREPHETHRVELPNLLRLPLSQLEANEVPASLRDGRMKVFFCQSGVRSRRAVAGLVTRGVSGCVSLREGATMLKKGFYKV